MKIKMKTKIFFTIVLWGITITAQSQTCFSNISSGAWHVSAQKTDGSLLVWGSGVLGQLANTTGVDEPAPVALANGTNWLLVKSGRANTFAIRSDNTLWGTGNNGYGALGIGSTVGEIFEWTQIGTASNWAKVAGGGYFTIGLKTNGSLWGWGENTTYQMGNNTCCVNQLTPIQIGTDTDWKEINASTFVAAGFAIKNNGTLWGWGSNASGVLCDYSSTPNRPIPAQLNPDTDWKSITAGGEHILALKNNNTLWSWGANQFGQLGRDTSPSNASIEILQVGTDTWKMVTAGISLSYGIKTDGTLWAWGKNDLGQLGNGNTVNQFAPIQIGTDNNWNSVSCGGYDFAVALKTDGSLWTWGQNSFGQLANGSTVPELLPTNVISCPLSAESFIAQNVNLHPNPTKEFVIIAYENLSNTASIEVYDLMGRLLSKHYAKNQTGDWRLNTSSYPTGVYVVVVKDKNQIIEQHKLLKE
ncbi:T9SS type A sorting domain-containing protein [Flavobacterium terrigena]|uniref:Por secretion system C-terminal sorting domain-containing protein n=2 Tax=Flavobacterium terrigena TaxID=402734 RepID=A0A1H6XTX0_9FLAO|nr:Por secretion system C-terminal sorting domain-containing protein [Flavobacterium terrigena]